MLLYSFARCLDCDQDSCVGCNNDAAWKDVAEDEQSHGVGASCRVLVGQAPVDAAGRAVGLRSVLPPVDQWGAGEQQRIDPSTGDEQVDVDGAEPVSCENEFTSLLVWKKMFLQTGNIAE